MTKPVDRVKYTELNLARDEFAEIQGWAERLGYFDRRPVTTEDPFVFEDYCDPRFEAARLPAMPLQENQP